MIQKVFTWGNKSIDDLRKNLQDELDAGWSIDTASTRVFPESPTTYRSFFCVLTKPEPEPVDPIASIKL